MFIWIIRIAMSGSMLFLLWFSFGIASAHDTASISVRSATIDLQDTPTVDSTVIALQKEQMVQQVKQLNDQNSWSILTILATPLSILIGLLTVLGGVWRYLSDQRTEREKQREVEKQQLLDRQVEREKQAEERFQKVVEGLGNVSEASRVGAAITLRTFLRKDKGYEQFYSQAFDLAVAHLRLRRIDPKKPEPPTSLSQALTTVLRESYPLARNWHKEHPRYLDASRIQLDYAYLSRADLQRIWIPKAHLRKATLRGTNLSGANLNGVDFTGANLCQAILIDADLYGAILCDADLNGADLNNVNLDNVKAWTNARLHNVKGVTQAQLAICHAKGAVVETLPASVMVEK